MKGFFSYYLTIMLLLLFAVLLVWYFKPTSSNQIALSPIPDFLTISKNNEVSSIDLFLPVLDFFSESSVENLAPTAKSVIVYDITTKKTLYERSSTARLPMASLTKVMTAIIGIENQLPSNEYIVSEENLVGENSMGLVAGEIHSLNNLLYGLILHSGNDAAEVIASHYPQGREAFIAAMNKKAKALGLKDTNFTNPSGLEGDGNQHSTAYDLMVITKYALDNYPLFAKIAKTPTYEIPGTATHQAYSLFNETNLLTTYPGVKGVKTGFTYEAGYCLITYLDYKGHKIIAVILGSQNRRAEMKDLLDYSLKKEGITPPKHD